MEGLPRRGSGVRDLNLPLPPDRVPRLVRGGRLLKRWHYVGVYGPELMLCVGDAHVGPLPQRWWAIATPDSPIVERSTLARRGLDFDERRVELRSGDTAIDLELTTDPRADVLEVASPAGRAWIWTRKHAAVRARGTVTVNGLEREVDAPAFVDESAGYHDRLTQWQWSAGVGQADGGVQVAWNLVRGIHDSPKDSERTIWVDGRAVEVGPVRFADDLSRIEFSDGGELRFAEWSERKADTHLGLFRSRYRQPFGTFEGELPGDLRLLEGHGVMEDHDVRW
jgi:hypothetical protein